MRQFVVYRGSVIFRQRKVTKSGSIILQYMFQGFSLASQDGRDDVYSNLPYNLGCNYGKGRDRDMLLIQKWRLKYNYEALT